MILIAVLNYVVNPYDAFNHDLNFYDSYDCNNDSEIVYPKLKLSINKNYDYFFCGFSNELTSFSKKDFAKMFPDKSMYKMGQYGGSVSNQYDMVKHFISVHPEVKTIFVSVYFGAMAKSDELLLPGYSGNQLNMKEWYCLLFSVDTLKYSLKSIYLTIKETLIPKAMFSLKNHSFFGKFKIFSEYKYKKCILRYPHARRTDWNEQKILVFLYNDLKRIKELCDKEQKEVIFYTSPLHANAIYDIYYQGGYAEIERFKRELVKISPFYDFLYVCEYTNKPISGEYPYWRDAFHEDTSMGDLIMTKVILGSGSYGVYVTKDNIEDVLKLNKQALFKYAKDNKEFLEKYTTYGHLDFTPEEKIIYQD